MGEDIQSAAAWPRRPAQLGAAAVAGVLVAGCDGPQSALAPAGEGARRIADLAWWMLGGGAVIWAAVIALAVYATFFGKDSHHPTLARWLILGGGAIVPTLVLAALLAYGLWLMPQLRAAPPADGLSVKVTGERWWWRVEYRAADGTTATLANEIRLPVGHRTGFTLGTADVIHSFWIPPLGGKMDMIPGRVTTLVLEPTETGTFRGACAEYCGTAHALMAFPVVVMKPEAFDAWLARQAEPASPPESALERRGRELFLGYGCGGCHAVRGTPADGRVGPDLTHVGSRLSLGAGVLDNDRDAFRHWIAETELVKPGVTMPSFPMPEDDLAAIAAWLDGLE